MLDSNLLLPLVEGNEDEDLDTDDSDARNEDPKDRSESLVVERLLIDGEEQRADDVSLKSAKDAVSSNVPFFYQAECSIGV